MPQIENCPMSHIVKGTHIIRPYNAVLIQITDPGYDAPFAMYHEKFKKVFRYEFHDVNPSENKSSTEIEYQAFTEKQASEILSILEFCLYNDYDLIVHCHAGLCRSGAIVEVGVMLGFLAVHENRIPNMHVKTSLLRLLRGNYTETFAIHK